jgi:hypothetical protein
MIFCHPQAHFYHRRVSAPTIVSDSLNVRDDEIELNTARAAGKSLEISSFFIGLSFGDMNFKSADVTPSILDFINRVGIYDKKKPSMEIVVTVSRYSCSHVIMI